METLLEAVDLVVGDPPSSPTSLSVRSGEILGLLFPPSLPRMPLLRALAGMDPPRGGAIHYSKRAPRIALVGPESLSDALALQPDVLLLDGVGTRDSQARSVWARVAAERACGTAVVVASGAPTAAVALQLRRLNRASKDLLAEGRRQARDTEQVVQMLRVASELAADSVADRVLNAWIAQVEDT